MAIIDFFDRGWRINPRGIAYVQGDRSYSFQEAGELSCRVANGLIASGFVKGTKAAVWAGNDVTAWICALGTWRAGLTWIPVSGHNASEDNQFILDAFDCEVLFFTRAYKDVVEALRSRLPKVRLWICIDARFHGLRRSRSGAPASRQRCRGSTTTWVTSWQSPQRAGRPARRKV